MDRRFIACLFLFGACAKLCSVAAADPTSLEITWRSGALKKDNVVCIAGVDTQYVGKVDKVDNDVTTLPLRGRLGNHTRFFFSDRPEMHVAAYCGTHQVKLGMPFARCEAVGDRVPIEIRATKGEYFALSIKLNDTATSIVIKSLDSGLFDQNCRYAATKIDLGLMDNQVLYFQPLDGEKAGIQISGGPELADGDSLIDLDTLRAKKTIPLGNYLGNPSKIARSQAPQITIERFAP